MRRVVNAWCRASVSNGVGREVATRQPSIRRDNTSTTYATDTNPVRVHAWGKVATHSCSGL
jgi:hypothetical protein